MAYTIASGVRRETWERFVRDSGLALPLIAVVFIIIAALSVSTSQSSGQSPYIQTKKPSMNVSAANTGPKKSDKPSTKSSSATTPAVSSAPAPQPSYTPAMSFAGLASPATPVSAPSTSTVTGGLGGGDLTGTTSGSAPSSGTTSGSGSGSTTPTVACTNLLTISQICTACTPPLTLQPGQKALLSADGTCVAVN